MEKLSFDEFLEVYRTTGEVGAKLVASNVAGIDFDELLEQAPMCVKYFTGRLLGYHWARLLRDHPEEAPFCNWESITSGQMVDLLASQPQFVDHAQWDTFMAHNWIDMLNRQPQFAKYFYTLPREKREYFWDMSYDILKLTSGAPHDA